MKSLAICAVLLVASMALNPKNPAYLGVQPPPQLVLSAVLGGLWGTLSGFLASLTFAFFNVYFQWLARDSIHSESFLESINLVTPAVSVILATVIGLMTDRWKMKLKYLSESLEESERHIASLEVVQNDLKKRGNRRQLESLSMAAQGRRVFEFAARMEGLSLENWGKEFVELLSEALNAENVAVFVRAPQGLLCLSSKKNIDFHFPKAISSTNSEEWSFLNHALERKDIVMSSQTKSIAIPAMSANRQVWGVVVLSNVQWENQNNSMLVNLESLARWAGAVLSNSQWRSGKLYNAAFDSSFETRLKTEFEYAKKFDAHMVVLKFRFKNWNALNSSEKIIASEAMSLEVQSPLFRTASSQTETLGDTTIVLVSSMEQDEIQKYIQAIEFAVPYPFMTYICRYKNGMRNLREFLESEEEWQTLRT